HAGTRASEDVAGDGLTAGGRVLSVVALGADLDEARARAYAAVDEISWDGEQHRTDIAQAAAAGTIDVAAIYAAPEAGAEAGPAGSSAAAPTAAPGSDAPVLPGWTHVYSGKVRDLYIPEDAAD
ncbi:hypothetical protein KCW65_21835, partial [Mycobacterium tuberculosis]|nr:hypothetical protein [Mycobacterium tuberculosis]